MKYNYPTTEHFWTMYKMLPPLTNVTISIIDPLTVADHSATVDMDHAVLAATISFQKTEFDSAEHREQIDMIKNHLHDCNIHPDTMLKKIAFEENFGFGYHVNISIVQY